MDTTVVAPPRLLLIQQASRYDHMVKRAKTGPVGMGSGKDEGKGRED